MIFQSTLFNKTEERDYFINPDCFGDDVCCFLISRLKDAGVNCEDEPRQEDWGWYFNFRIDDVQYAFNCGLRRNWGAPPGIEEESWDEAWICFVERRGKGFLSLFGGGDKTVALEAVQQIHNALASTDAISSIRWHEQKEFDKNNEEAGTATPN